MNPELKEKARACHSAEELLELAKEEGMELSDEQLEAVAGGEWCQQYDWTCPEEGTSA